MSGAQPGETSAQIRARVIAARERQHARFAGKPKVTCNARMGSRELKQFCELDDTTKDLLKFAMTDLNLSARAYDRILKVARTIADLAGVENISSDHISEAIQFRSLRPTIVGLMRNKYNRLSLDAASRIISEIHWPKNSPTNAISLA